ncbi:hypothetical protein CWM91_15025, partial [Klebsiella pneumoniae]
RMIHSHATIFLVSLASHHEESEGDFTQNGGKIDRKRYFVSLMMRFSIQNVNYLVAHIHGINFYEQTLANVCFWSTVR